MDATELTQAMDTIKKLASNRYGHGSVGTLQLLDSVISLANAVDHLNRRIEELEGEHYGDSTRTTFEAAGD